MQIKDSGKREVYESGAVRDVGVGKGRCDLLPLKVIGDVMNDYVLLTIGEFMKTRDVEYIYKLLDGEIKGEPSKILDLSTHFEKGAIKYEERNWERGIPIDRYIDSGVRHYLKYLDKQDDENHYISFIWNMVCLIWTYENLGDGIENN